MKFFYNYNNLTESMWAGYRSTQCLSSVPPITRGEFFMNPSWYSNPSAVDGSCNNKFTDSFFEDVFTGNGTEEDNNGKVVSTKIQLWHQTLHQ